MEGKRVIFVENENEPENADGMRGHLEAVCDMEEAKRKRDKALGIKLMEEHKPRGLNLLILGAGSHGQEVYEIANDLHIFTKIDFLDDDNENLNAIGSWEDIYELRDEYTAAIVAVGDEKLRKLWFSKLVEAGYVIPSLVHPSAIISSNAKIGVGSVICARSAISPGAIVGNGCIISAGVAVARDAKVEDWTHIDGDGVVAHRESRGVV